MLQLKKSLSFTSFSNVKYNFPLFQLIYGEKRPGYVNPVLLRLDLLT